MDMAARKMSAQIPVCAWQKVQAKLNLLELKFEEKI
jgi:hypothetical protein